MRGSRSGGGEGSGEAEAKRLLARAGIASAPEAECANADAAVAAAERIGFPVVMKILSPDILHKSEIGGVLLNVSDAAAVRDGFGILMDRAKRAGLPGSSPGTSARLDGVWLHVGSPQARDDAEAFLARLGRA